MSIEKGQAAGFFRNWYFSITIFFSSFLLFQIQPIMGKFILPWFGGTSTVWTTCMMVYQALLLGGYMYAHTLSGLSIRKHVRLHLAVLSVSFVVFACLWMQWKTPITPGQNWQPVDSSLPVMRIVTLLLACIGLPFLLLSSTSSLVQKWFSILNPGKSPYGFYMISNIGSMLALVSYPFVFEPHLRLETQAVLWSVMYLVYIVICTSCIVIVYRKGKLLGSPDVPPAGSVAAAALKADEKMPAIKTQFAWLLLSLFPCILLLSTSTEMTQNIAPIPLLWILPLALFLLSFIISFSPISRPLYWLYIPLVLVSSFLTLLVLKDGPRFGLIPAIVVFSVALFSSCMLCNTVLYSLRPTPVHLTRYYVVMALGGAIGGIFVGVVAPMLFNNYYEFKFGLIFACILGVIVMGGQKQLWVRFIRMPMVFVSVIVIVLLFLSATHVPSHSIYRSRNFYGQVTVRSIDGPHGWVRHSLVHGNIAHGIQIQNSPIEFKPVSYYAKEGGIGYAMQRFSLRPLRIGVIGLGAGMICTYAEENDYVKFYEINQDVVDVATNPAYFSYISHCQATVDISLGDARISLERELKEGHPQKFDVLLIDAFNADSVPVHLLTKEAFKLYLAHVAPTGLIVVNVSNTYIDLVPQIWAQKKYFDLDGAVIRARKNYKKCTDASTWVLLSRDSSFFLMPSIQEAAVNATRVPQVEIWTDDYSSLLPAIRRVPFSTEGITDVFRAIAGMKKP